MVYKKGLYGFLPRFVILSAAALTLAACGGGGGGGDNTPPPPAPVAVADAVTTASGAAVTISVLANDTISAGAINPASVVIASQSANGTAVANADGTVTFTPAAGFAAATTATTTFTYTVASNTVPASTSNAATVAVTVASPQTWFFTDATTLKFFSNGAELTASQVTSFDTSTLYYNVHSLANPVGEIRGQIIPSATTFLTDNGVPGTSNIFSALLTADQETPATTSKATAYGTIVLDPVANTISGVMVTNGLTGIAAHIHGTALPGVPAGVLFPLTGGPTVYTLPPTPITAAQIADLKAGLYYLNVHTNEEPNGELRGQLTQQARFAALNSVGEVPAIIPTAIPSSGVGVLALTPTADANGNFPISGFVKTNGIVGGLVAHIHQGAAGVAGPVIVQIFESSPGSGLWVVPAGATLTPSQVVAFNTNNLYYQVHTTLNPGGEIRDQLVPATIKIGTATLTGANEVPAVATAAAGTGIMALNSVTRLVNGNVFTTGIVGTVAHVHEGAPGVVSPVIIPLSLTPPVSTILAPLAISTTTLPDGTVGSAYSQTLTATGGTTPYTWALTAGTPPAGLNVAAAGSINGTPTAAGLATFTVGVTDSSVPPVTVTMALSLNVTAAAAATILFSTQVQPIFTANCLTSCHSPGGISAFLNLTAGSSYAALTAAPAHVIAGNSAGSLLYQKITGASPPQMPLGQPPLSASDQTLIKNWIDQGALNN